jgi:hypothetical protein
MKANLAKEQLMKYPILISGAAMAAALGLCGAFAQTTPAPTDSGKGVAPPVVTDVGPAPAQERDSLGAVILHDSPVLAQRRLMFERAASRTGVVSVGRGVVRATMKAQREAELAQAREREAAEMHRRGAGGLTEK